MASCLFCEFHCSSHTHAFHPYSREPRPSFPSSPRSLGHCSELCSHHQSLEKWKTRAPPEGGGSASMGTFPLRFHPPLDASSHPVFGKSSQNFPTQTCVFRSPLQAQDFVLKLHSFQAIIGAPSISSCNRRTQQCEQHRQQPAQPCTRE